MYKIQTLNNIAEEGINLFAEKNYIVEDEVVDPDAFILRSYNMHEMKIPNSVKAVARAGAGTNNIPINDLTDKGIVVFNTPGANANAVKELVIAGLLLSSRKIAAGMQWVKSQSVDSNFDKKVEKSKAEFGGQEIQGKTLGVIGLGAIGVMVANAATSLGMNVMGFDPYISVKAAWGLESCVMYCESLESLLSKADYISLHIPLTENTKGYLSDNSFKHMKQGVRILNFARGELVDNNALKNALSTRKCKVYITDFPASLPSDLLQNDGVVALPHLGASTVESEINCATMAADQLIDFLENGNVINSVNFPNCVMDRTGASRVICANKNVPNMVGQITAILAKYNVNIADMVNRSMGNYAYTIIDSDNLVTEEIVNEIKSIPNVIMTRAL